MLKGLYRDVKGNVQEMLKGMYRDVKENVQRC